MIQQDNTNTPIEESKINKDPYIIVFGKDRLGEGSEELGNALAGAMLNTTLKMELKPEKIIFINSGINLVVEGSLVLPQLKQLEESGTKLLICGTCLDYFDQMDKIKIGSVSNMIEIMDSLSKTSKIINI